MKRGWSATTSRTGRRALYLYLLAFLVFLYAPTAVLLLFSFSDSDIPAFPITGLTTKWYSALVHNDQLRDAILTSLQVATFTAAAATALGVAAAWALARGKLPGRSALQSVLVLPLIVPYVVMGIGLLVLFQSLGVALSTTTVAVGHVVITLPYVLLTVLPRILSLDRSLEEAAQDLGASGVYRFRRVVLPLIAPALASAFIMAFVISMDEFPIASFVVGPNPTFPVYLFGQLRYPDRLPQVIAVTAVVQIVSLALVVAAEALRRTGGVRLRRHAE